MITALLLVHAAVAQLPAPADGIGMLPPRPWYSKTTQVRASLYYQCRRRGVGGSFADVESVAQGRLEVALMLYERRAACRRERARFLSSLETDAERVSKHVSPHPGEPEFLLDAFEHNLDERMQSAFSWSGLPER
jgi:hypothetical protein